MIRKFRIEMTITLVEGQSLPSGVDSAYSDTPEHWDFAELLDLGAGESVQIESHNEIPY